MKNRDLPASANYIHLHYYIPDFLPPENWDIVNTPWFDIYNIRVSIKYHNYESDININRNIRDYNN